MATAVAALAANVSSSSSSRSPNSGSLVEPVERAEHAERALAVAQRHQQRGLGARDRRAARRARRAAPRRRRSARDARCAAPPRPRTRPRAATPPSVPASSCPAPAAATSRSPSREQQHHGARAHERAPALDDQLEHAVEIGLGAERAGDRRGRLEPLDGALELGRAFERDLVEARVVDRDRGPVGEHAGDVQVGIVELAALPSRSGTGCPRPRRGSAAAARGTCVIGGWPAGKP